VSAPRVAALLLAAGHARRMGGQQKLLAEWAGKPLLAHAAGALLASRITSLHVVVGADATALREALSGRALDIVENPEHAEGMAASLRAGLGALREPVDAVLVCLGDMPRVRAEHVDALIDRFEEAGAEAICVPVHGGRRGHPVLFAAAYFDALCVLQGDRGARELLESHPEYVHEVLVPDDDIHSDVDTAEDLRVLRRGVPVPTRLVDS